MELRLDDIRKSSDPYQLFLDSLKNKHTFRKYKNALHQFLALVPAKIYEEELGKNPENREPNTLAKYFVNLTKKNPDLVTRIIAQFVKKENQRRVENDKLNQNVRKRSSKSIKPIKSRHHFVNPCYIVKNAI